MMKGIGAIIASLRKEIASGKEFDFSRYISEFEKSCGKTVSGNMKKQKGAMVRGSLIVGKGTEILPGTVVEGNVIIGKNCKIGPNAYLRG